VRRRDLLAGLPGLLRAATQSQSGPMQFVDIAATAGLVHPVVYGGVKSKKYILETNGCGIAFLF